MASYELNDDGTLDRIDDGPENPGHVGIDMPDGPDTSPAPAQSSPPEKETSA